MIGLGKRRDKVSSNDTEVRSLLIDHIAQFAENLFESSTDEQALHDELDRFLEFFCNALTAAERDGRRQALVTNLN